MWTPPPDVGRRAAYPSVDEVLQELEGGAAEAAPGEDDVYGQYAWEREVERSWDLLVGESESYSELHAPGLTDDRVGGGRRSNSSGTDASAGGGRDAAPEAHIKKGLLRSLVLLVDMSEATREKDYRPDRLTCICQATEEFISAFLLQSPLAQVALVALVGPCAEPVCLGGGRADGAAAAGGGGTGFGEGSGSSYGGGGCFAAAPEEAAATAGSVTQLFSSNAEECIAALKEKRRRAAASSASSGAPSLRNGLQVAKDLLSLVPPYCTREILILYGSLRTCDVGNIEETLLSLKKARICCSVICLAAELYVLKRLCQETGGRHCVPMHREHLRALILQVTRPPPWTRRMQPCLIRMGFPSYKINSTAALCGCHQRLTYAAYVCPQCSAKLCTIPSRCRCCFLHLVSPADISRAFHNLCPPPPFEQLPSDFPAAQRICAACGIDFGKGGSRCPECLNIFCADCDVYTHEQLRQCGFCVVKDIAGLDEEEAEKEEKGKTAEKEKLAIKAEEGTTESGGRGTSGDVERNKRVKVMPREGTLKVCVKVEQEDDTPVRGPAASSS